MSVAEFKPRPAAHGESRDILLSLQKIAKQYAGTGNPTTALDSVTLDITRGEFVAIVGPSGCGKSTLRQIAAGLLKATSGMGLLDGKPVTGPPPEIVYLFQQYSKSLFPWRRVRENVMFALERKPLSRTEQKERALFYLSMVGL